MYMVQEGLQVIVQAVVEEQPGVIQHLACLTIGGGGPGRKENSHCPWILGILDSFLLFNRDFLLHSFD